MKVNRLVQNFRYIGIKPPQTPMKSREERIRDIANYLREQREAAARERAKPRAKITYDINGGMNISYPDFTVPVNFGESADKKAARNEQLAKDQYYINKRISEDRSR